VSRVERDPPLAPGSRIFWITLCFATETMRTPFGP